MGDNAPLLDASSVSKHFGGLKAISDVDLRVSKGEIVSVIGPNGAGKTTLFNVLTGFLPADSGTIRFNGQDISRLSANRRVTAGMARSFQLVESFDTLTVRMALTTAALLRHPMKDAQRAADKLIEMLDLQGQSDKTPAELPLPAAKLLELGKCLATEPQIILLDEMMSGLTAGEAQIPRAIINRLSEEGVACLLVEHVMPIVMQISHRVVVLSFGEKICDDTPENVAADNRVRQAYLGGDSFAS